MPRIAALSFKICYCLAVLAAIIPIGLEYSGLFRSNTGASPLVGMLMIGPLLFLALGLYRVFLVARVPGTLDSQPVEGIVTWLRNLGEFFIYAGALIGLLKLAAIPLMRGMAVHSDSGVEFYIVGLLFAFLGSFGTLGLVSFEFSRLLAFERHARETSH